ncbi:RNA-directed DNA polymerase, eukaryota, reverse transcriptase zinc-binding domain protein [Tanacetum coccineum]
MECGFLSQKGSRGRRGVKEKDLNWNNKNTSSGIGVSMDSDDTMNDDTPIGVASAVQEDVTPYVADMTVEMEKQTLWKILLFWNLFHYYLRCSIDGLNAMLENCLWFIRNNPLIMKKWHSDENLLKEDVSTVPVWVKLHGVPVTGRSSYARAMIELRADVELKDKIAVDMPKIIGDGHYICNVRVEYEWKPPRCASCKVFGHIHKECPENTGVGEKKTLKKPSQTSRGVPVGPKIGFKPQKEYRLVPKKPTASSSGNKKKGVEPTIEVSNSNPFEVLNSVDNDVELVTNEGTTNLKFKELLTSGQSILVDEAGNPLKKVEFLGDYDTEDEVASVDNDMTRSMASERVDLYDDDMYEGQDLPQEIQAICDNLDIRVRCRKKK